MTRRIRETPTLPVEIVLTIIARADPVTVVRCAAASKLLRRHIADPAFHAEVGAAGRGRGGAYDPSLLLGIFQQHRDGEPYRFVPVPPSRARLTLPLMPAGDALPNSFEPVASRGGLVVLRRRQRVGGPVELCVCSPVAGRRSLIILPPLSLDYYDSHVLLPGDEDDDSSSSTGRRHFSFRLLVVEVLCQTQTFSSRTGAWGPVTEVAGGDGYWPVRPTAVVLRGVAHWLCRRDHVPPRGSSEEFFTYRVVSLRVDTTGAPQLAGAAIEVPQCCLRRRYRYPAAVPRSKELLLVSTAEGRLGLLVAEIMAISIWVVPSGEDDSWGARRVVVDKAAMLRSVELRWELHICVTVEMEWFGEASGAVVLQVHGAGVLVLDLRTGGVVQLSLHLHKPLRCCPYEAGLLPLLASISSA